MYNYESLRNNPEILKAYKSREQVPLKCHYCEDIHYRTRDHIRQALSTNIQYNNCKNCKGKQLEYQIPCICNYCSKTIYKQKSLIKDNNYCNTTCYGNFYNRTEQVICKGCGINFPKKRSNILKSKNHFHTTSCANMYNNLHRKTKNRSKLEIIIQDSLVILFPNLDIQYNNRKEIGYELDIYIPSLKLAFEINGIRHYSPINGKERLDKVKITDETKILECKNRNIDLTVINSSKQNLVTIDNSQEYLKIILDKINSQYMCNIQTYQ